MKADSESFVIDASVAVAWVHPSQAIEYSNSVLRAFLGGARLHAPSLWPTEVANALIVLLRRGKLTKDEREDALRRLSKLSIIIDHEGPNNAFTRISDLALQFGLSAYDATYLELAQRAGLPLACKDGPLREAATKAHVAIWRGAR
jgi:predicted nucleic acid-binding protein